MVPTRTTVGLLLLGLMLWLIGYLLPLLPALAGEYVPVVRWLVYGFYAGNDMRVDATVPPTTDAMKELKKTYDVVTYEGAGHGFMRAGEPNNPEPPAPVAKGDGAADKRAAEDDQKALAMYKANRKARDEAWTRWKAILANL